VKRILLASLLGALCSITVLAQAQSRADILKQIETKRAELAKLEANYVAISADDRATFAEFLSQPDTGLIRLMPREKFDSYANQQSGLTLRGGGSYYSFTRHLNDYGFATDLGLEQGYLKVGFYGASYGMLVKLDDVRLEDVSLELPAVSFLARYTAVGNEPDARVEQRRVGTGTVVDGVAYKDRLKASVGATYVLRSINFDEADVLVAFKVVRQDEDGSLIIPWRLLHTYSVPRLARTTQATNAQ
jgi:hypothetical protein